MRAEKKCIPLARGRAMNNRPSFRVLFRGYFCNFVKIKMKKKQHRAFAKTSGVG